jgi:hypothetical protein
MMAMFSKLPIVPQRELPRLCHFLCGSDLRRLTNTSSGRPEIAVHAWAILLRCHCPSAIYTCHWLKTRAEWFSPSLSGEEVACVMQRINELNWLASSDDSHSYQTTSQVAKSLPTLQKPLFRGAIWCLMNAPPSTGDRP